VSGRGPSGTPSLQPDHLWGPGGIPPSALPVLPATVGPLNSSVGFNVPNQVSGQSNAWTMNWNLTPIVPPVDILITIPNYCTW
jgi:hypothetical protein